MTKKLLVAGASISAGYGLLAERYDPALWVNQLAKKSLDIELSNIHNVSIAGSDNNSIFRSAVGNMLTESYNYIIVCWQIMPRFNYTLGLENYDTTVNLIGKTDLKRDIHLAGYQTASKKEIAQTHKFFSKYHNYHWDILELISYIQVLNYIANTQNSHIYYVNYRQPWETNRMFDRKEWSRPSDLDKCTCEILSTDFRDDTDSQTLYNMIHDSYVHNGGIQEDYWLNLYNPLEPMSVDTVSDSDNHPGYKSQQIFEQYLSSCLKEHLK
jgi:hypothetical protein